jgi:hypothetical protein
MDADKNDETNCKRRLLWQYLLWNSTTYKLLTYQNRLTSKNTLNLGRIEVLGQRHLQIYKVTLPFDATGVFQKIISAYNQFRLKSDKNIQPVASNRNASSSLYSLTKHDVAIADLPGNFLEIFQEIQSFVVNVIQHLYYIPSSQSVYLDRHQPHVLKYDASSEQSFRSVPLHHDCCHGMHFRWFCIDETL